MASTSQMDVDQAQMSERDEEIEKLLQITRLIVNELGEDMRDTVNGDIVKGIFDLDLSNEISGLLMIVFSCLRKEEHDKVGHNRYLAYSTKVKGVEVTVKGLVDKIKSQSIKINFMVATSTVEILTIFNSFFHEVRTGVTRFRASVAKRGYKRDQEGRVVVTSRKSDDTQTISQYGLTNQHICLLQGITLAPERRIGIVRSLGPLAKALLLIMEDKYFDKLKSALSNSLQMLPMAQEIITALKEAGPGNVSGIMKELGDILLLTTARSTQKVYFPLLLFTQLWSTKGDMKWSFSGAAAIKYYTDFCNTGKVQFNFKSGGYSIKTSEVVFHAMFGTYLEDLGILEQITTRPKWHKRKELNSVFNNRASQSVVKFKPITFKYVYQMAQGLLTKSLGNVGQTISRPSFAGFRKRHFTQEFLTYITTGKNAIHFSSDPIQLHHGLKKLKHSLIEEKEKLLKSGTNKWEMKSKDGWEQTDFEPSAKGIFFYGN